MPLDPHAADDESDDSSKVTRLIELLPTGVSEVARNLRDVADARLGRSTGSAPADSRPLLRDLVLPLLVEPDWPAPAPPIPVRDGWVQADLIDEDAETFARLRSLLPDAGPEELAAAAQDWRLPVVPYRSAQWRASADATAPRPTAPPTQTPAQRDGSLASLRVVDLTSLWAGPLATRLLADSGAQVVKIDPDCRPDGFRARPALYHALNRGKDIVDLDLREPSHRAEFEGLVCDADLLVESFSRRVLPNLGYGPDALRALNPRIATLSIVGFPRGCPEQDWLAYGTGIHAISGHGMTTGRAQATPLAWPDALAGHAAFAQALELLGSNRHAELSLVSTAAAVHRITDASPRDTDRRD